MRNGQIPISVFLSGDAGGAGGDGSGDGTGESSGDSASSASGGDSASGPDGASSSGAARTEAASKGKREPDPVPYQVFRDTNTQLRAAEDRLAELERKLEQSGEHRDEAERLKTELATERQTAERRVALADAGADARYRDYLLERYAREDKPPKLAAWLEQLRSEEPAFFGGAGGTGSAVRRSSPSQTAQVTAATDNGKPFRPGELTAKGPEFYRDNREQIHRQAGIPVAKRRH